MESNKMSGCRENDHGFIAFEFNKKLSCAENTKPTKIIRTAHSTRFIEVSEI